MTPSPHITSSRTLHSGKKFDFVSLTVQRPSGQSLTREIVRHPGAIVVVPILNHPGGPVLRTGSPSTSESPNLPPGRYVVLIQNFRITLNDWLLECCAGTIERTRLPAPTSTQTFVPFDHPGAESPASCAARELIEETGFRAATLSPLHWYYTTPGLTDEQMFAFLATNLTHVGQHLEPDESIHVELIPAAQILPMINNGRIRDAKSILALLLAHQKGLL